MTQILSLTGLPWNEPTLPSSPQGPQTLPLRLLSLISHGSSLCTSSPHAGFCLQATLGHFWRPCPCRRCALRPLHWSRLCSSLKAAPAVTMHIPLSPQ